MTTQNILESRKRRLELQYTQVDELWQTHNQKLQSLKAAMVKEAGTAVRFQLQEEIKIEKKQLAYLDDQMVDLETELKRVSYKIDQLTESPTRGAAPLENAGAASQVKLPELRSKLVKYFNKSELLTIVFDLSIDYEAELDLSTKQTMVRTLLEYLERTGRLSELLSIVSYQRPAATWS